MKNTQSMLQESSYHTQIVNVIISSSTIKKYFDTTNIISFYQREY